VDIPFRARAVRVSALAAALAAPRRPLSPAVLVICLVVAGLVELAAVQTAMSEDGRYGTGELAGVGGIAVTLLAVFVSWWRREAARRGQMVERARYLWRRSWYCHRCGAISVFWTGGARVLGARSFAADLMALARQIKWERRV
jgi:hypothetical protein